MKAKEILKLKKGDKVKHKHYNICSVQEVKTVLGGELFGLVIIPDNNKDKKLLAYRFGAKFGTPLLETSYRLLENI